MEQIICTPNENSDVIKAHDEILNTSFGGGAFPGFGIFGLLLTMLFNPNTMLNNKHPFPNINDEDGKEMENTETPEEKEQILKSHLDEYGTKLFDKMKDPETTQDLLNRLSDVNSKLQELESQKQDIIDDGVME